MRNFPLQLLGSASAFLGNLYLQKTNWCKRKKYNFSKSKAEEIYGKAKELVPVLPKDDITKLIIKQAVDKQKRVVRLDAIGTNVPAQKLYEKYGFVNCGIAQEYNESTGKTEFVFYEYALTE